MPPRGGCILCGAAGLTNEHAWPKWLRTVFYFEGPEIINELVDEDGAIVRLHPTVTIDTQVRRVCGDCNSVWMSRMEGATQEILTPLIRGEPTTLSADDQSTLAMWLVKTGMMLELATHKPTIPLDHYRLFRAEERPLDFTVAYLSSMATEDGPGLSYMKQDKSLTVSRPSDLLVVRSSKGVVEAHRTLRAVNCHLQTIRLGLFVGQVFWTEDADAALIFLNSKMSKGHIRAWPNPIVQMWPTTRIPNFESFQAFARRLNLLTERK